MQSMLPDAFEIEIRRLKAADIDQVMAIEPIAYGNHHWSSHSFENELKNEAGLYFAAVIAKTDQLVGYTGFWLIGDEVHITTLAVHPDFQRQHIGERLLINNIIAARKEGARWITLEVRASNEKAQKLYSKYGFKTIGVRKNYYQNNGEDALILWTENMATGYVSNFLDERIAAFEAQFNAQTGWFKKSKNSGMNQALTGRQ